MPWINQQTLDALNAKAALLTTTQAQLTTTQANYDALVTKTADLIAGKVYLVKWTDAPSTLSNAVAPLAHP